MGSILVEVRNDFEGMFGGIPSEEMETIDIDRTLAEYENELYNELRVEYPDVSFDLYYGSYGGPSILIDNCNDWDEEITLSEGVSEIISDVYQRGSFWITKGK
jgi:hypothetical protein